MLICSIAEIRAQETVERQEVDFILQSVEQLMQGGRYQQAADILEKFLMTRTVSEDVIKKYQQVLKRIDQNMGLYKPQSQVQGDKEWHTQGKMNVSLGGGNNLNRAPSEKNIKITLSGGNASLKLDSEQQPQAGFGVEAMVNIRASKRLNTENKINLAMQVQHRTTEKKNFTDYLQMNSSVSLQHTLNQNSELGVALFADVLQYDNEARFYSIDLLTQYGRQINQNCQSQMGVDLQWKHQKDNRLFDVFYTGTAVSIGCQWAGDYKIGVNAGNEWALDSSRPGGSQWRMRIQLIHDGVVNGVTQKDGFSQYLNLEGMYDQSGYSDLLDKNKKRVMHRLAIGIKYRTPIIASSKDWWWVLKSDWQKQYSNIQLFEFQSYEIWGGVEVEW